jgi:transposase
LPYSEGGELHVLAVLPDRLKASVVAWLTSIPATSCTQSKTVCTNIWDGYRTAIQEVLPDARIVIDRFHLARHYRDPVDAVYKPEMRRGS